MSLPSQELHGRHAVVTGSSSGIGRAMALELAAAGANVLVHAGHRREAADAVAAEVRSRGGMADTVVVDLATAAGCDELIERASKWRGEIDVWINNAGADVLTGATARATFDAKLELLWRIDVAATMRLSRAIGGRMKLRGLGAILNIGWDQAETGMAGDTAELFAATKGAVMTFTRSLAKSLAPEVRVNCLAPGWIKTAWGEHASQAWQERAGADSLLGRWGTPEEVARVARFLVSPAAQFMTGQIVAVNGGR